MRTLLIIVAPAFLAACAPHAQENIAAAAPSVGCDAGPAQRWIGQTSTAALVESARKASGASVARALTPGMMVTMEFRADRLNVTVDEKGLVTAIGCG